MVTPPDQPSACAIPAPPAATAAEPPSDLAWRVGGGSIATLGVVLLAWALTVDVPRATGAFFGDGATYYCLTHSLAQDFDFEYRREDIQRVWREYQTGPEGLFLKRGRDVQGVSFTAQFPFVRLETANDSDAARLYYAKSFIYPLFAAPFVRVFGTNGFLVLHALLMTICFACAYAFLVARSHPIAAVLFAAVFLFISATPVYLAWLTPDFFNLAAVLIGYFFWTYKEVAAESVTVCPGPWRSKWLLGPRSDVVAVVLLGIATFSKPTNVFLVIPIVILALWRSQWRRGLVIGAVFTLIAGGLFAWNIAITGEWNYQGGDRRTFLGELGGFPFQNERTFDSVGVGRATNQIPLEVLTSRDALVQVFRKNLGYFFVGRHHGFVPYFFPGAVAMALFLFARTRRRAWQWLTLAAGLGSAVFLLLYMPFTYSGGGGPVANRYYLSVYPVFLFLTPPMASIVPAVVAGGIGALFTAQLVTNIFYVSIHPAEHAKHFPYRWLPAETTLVNDLPINHEPARSRQPLGGKPPVMAYFLDNNVFDRETDAYWVRGESRSEVLLRAPSITEQRDGQPVVRPFLMPRMEVQLETGDVPNRVRVDTGVDEQVVEIPPHDRRTVIVRMGAGTPYRRDPWLPTNYVYVLSIESETGFVPVFHSTNPDTRFLGVYVRLVPLYE
jgi:hypothetical protein